MLMTDRELLELLVKRVEGIDDRFDRLENRFDGLENRFDGLEKRVGAIEADLASVKETVVRIENDHGQQLKALFDGQRQNREMLERIAIEVSRHEEIILRRVSR